MFISLEKRSKKERKEYYKKKRSTWGDIKPYTKVRQSKKAYHRNKKVEYDEETYM